MRHEEENLQIRCVEWFGLAYPAIRDLLHHSPNGGRRNAREGARFKAMGTRRGFPDLLLLYPSKGYHGLFIEMKSEKGRQQPSQKEWQTLAERVGYKYVICRSLGGFMDEVNGYLEQGAFGSQDNFR